MQPISIEKTMFFIDQLNQNKETKNGFFCVINGKEQSLFFPKFSNIPHMN